MFLLDEGDLALAAAACDPVVPVDAGVGDQLRRFDTADRRTRPRAQTDPDHPADAWKAGAQIGEGGVVIEHVRLSRRKLGNSGMAVEMGSLK
jgi:hypothetical protein